VKQQRRVSGRAVVGFEAKKNPAEAGYQVPHNPTRLVGSVPGATTRVELNMTVLCQSFNSIQGVKTTQYRDKIPAMPDAGTE